MDIKQTLIDNGIDAEIAEKASKSIKSDIGKEFVAKDQYAKKISAIGDLQVKYDALEAEYGTMEGKAKDATKYKNDYDNLVTEHNNYKQEVETKESNSTKTSKLIESLKSEGFNEKIIPLLTKEFDVSKIEIEEDKIKGWEEMSKGVKESYKDFITVTGAEGNPPATPPTGGGKAETAMTLGSALHEKFKI